ncbi:MAG TPA: hypothetical protein VM942_10735 [Acidimicrobiales bacterium]|nr:hypothetical protein [Acidimicrobiales bacterium]
MSVVEAYEVLEAARTHVGMTFDDLWLAYFALGGLATPIAVRSFLSGSEMRSIDYDTLAHAINERFVELGGNHPVPYSNDLG